MKAIFVTTLCLVASLAMAEEKGSNQTSKHIIEPIIGFRPPLNPVAPNPVLPDAKSKNNLFIPGRDLGKQIIKELIARGDKGNGGDAVVCRDEAGQIFKTEALDMYEAKLLKTPVADHSSSDLREFIATATNALNQCNSALYNKAPREGARIAKALEQYARSRISNSRNFIFAEGPLEEMNDSVHALVADPGCEVEQLVVRLDGKSGDQYVWQAEILEHLAANDLKAIVLHEVIFKSHIKKNDAQYSSKVRNVVRTVMAAELSEMGSADFCQAINQ